VLTERLWGERLAVQIRERPLREIEPSGTLILSIKIRRQLIG
jgi:hypothetical protein